MYVCVCLEAKKIRNNYHQPKRSRKLMQFAIIKNRKEIGEVFGNKINSATLIKCKGGRTREQSVLY